MASHPNPNFDENQWIISVCETLEKELEHDSEIPVCIFNVPKTLMSTDRHSYIPQEVGIGPYHYWRPELYEMQRYKLAAAQRAQRKLQGDHNFEYVVDQVKELNVLIRACYHKYLNFSDEILAWMMAIDASFLLDFLQIYAMKESKLSATSSSKSLSNLVDYAGTKAAHNAILRDIMMLENQIPLLVLRKILEIQYSSLESADDMLQVILMGFCEEISPFKRITKKPIRVLNSTHLLDFLYDTIVPKDEQDQPEITENDDNETQPVNLSRTKRFFNLLWKFLASPFQLIKKLFVSKTFQVFYKLLWRMLSRIPGISVLGKPFRTLVFPVDGKDKKTDEESSGVNKPPSVEEIAIPSVSELCNSNVRFSAAGGNVSTVSFNPKTATLYLPKISLDVNSEVILRNLVAYEASAASGTLVFTRYTELMNGIIDTAEDARLLREKGIILNRLKSDAEVANLWNGMSKSIRLTKVPHLDKAIEDVNKHYRNQWKIKLRNCVNRYVIGSWQVITLLITVLFLVLTIWQAYCSSYHCHGHNHDSSN